MPKINKDRIRNFDEMTLDQLFEEPTKAIVLAIYLKTKQINGKVRFHDWFIKGLIGTIGLGIVTSIAIGIINLCYF